MNLQVEALLAVTLACSCALSEQKCSAVASVASGASLEVEMFARKVAVRLNPNSLGEFTRLIDREIVPWLRQQEGFLDLIILAVPDGSEVATISFWDHEGCAHAYDSTGYPEVLRLLGRLFDGVPYVKNFDVVSSTFPTRALLSRETRSPAPKSGLAEWLSPA